MVDGLETVLARRHASHYFENSATELWRLSSTRLLVVVPQQERGGSAGEEKTSSHEIGVTIRDFVSQFS
eukprot:scaffold2911_cov177-Amphora_coffeaeformis.AAC.3